VVERLAYVVKIERAPQGGDVFLRAIGEEMGHEVQGIREGFVQQLIPERAFRYAQELCAAMVSLGSPAR
jgi:hypothetical protein